MNSCGLNCIKCEYCIHVQKKVKIRDAAALLPQKLSFLEVTLLWQIETLFRHYSVARNFHGGTWWC